MYTLIKKFLFSFLQVCFLSTLLYGSTIYAIQTNEKNVVIEPKGVEKAEVEIIFASGELLLVGNASELMEGNFRYNTKEPRISYDALGDDGYLYMEQKNEESVKTKSLWDVKLGQTVPLDLQIATGGSKANLDLRQLRLQNVTVESGVGDTVINLSGEYEKGFHVSINAGVGNTTIYLPKNIAVVIKAKSGRGKITAKDLIEKERNTYVNQAYEENTTNVILHIEVNMGIGQVEFIET